MSGNRWQFVWWGFTFEGRPSLRSASGVCLRGWRRKYPDCGPHRGCIYTAMYRIGPLELRRWAAVEATEATDRDQRASSAVGKRREVRVP